MKKLPKISEFSLYNSIHNNKKVFDSLKEKDADKKIISKKEIKVKNKKDILTVKEKIKELIKGNNYIFNTKVILVFDDREEEVNIAGVVNNHIITMNNEIIKIDDLKDIKY